MEQSLTESPNVQQDSPVRQFPNANNAQFLKGRGRLLELRREGIKLKIPGAHQMSIIALEVAIPIAQAEQALAKQELTQDELDVLREEQLDMAEGIRKLNELYEQPHNESVLESEQEPEPEPSELVDVIELVPPTWTDSLWKINQLWAQQLLLIRVQLQKAADAVEAAHDLHIILTAQQFDTDVLEKMSEVLYETRSRYEVAYGQLTEPLNQVVALELALATAYLSFILLRNAGVFVPDNYDEFFAGYNVNEQAARFILDHGPERAGEALLSHRLTAAKLNPVW